MGDFVGLWGQRSHQHLEHHERQGQPDPPFVNGLLPDARGQVVDPPDALDPDHHMSLALRGPAPVELRPAEQHLYKHAQQPASFEIGHRQGVIVAVTGHVVGDDPPAIEATIRLVPEARYKLTVGHFGFPAT